MDRHKHKQEVESLKADNRQKDMDLSKDYVTEWRTYIAEPLTFVDLCRLDNVKASFTLCSLLRHFGILHTIMVERFNLKRIIVWEKGKCSWTSQASPSSPSDIKMKIFFDFWWNLWENDYL